MTNSSFSILRWTGGTLLAFIAACGGRYDIGDEAKQAAGAGGSATNATGGSANADSMSAGGRGASAGGSSASVGGSDSSAGGSGAGRASVGGRGSVSTGGSMATGGRSGGALGGSSGTTPASGGSTDDDPTCGVRLIALDTSAALSPENIWQRVDLLLDNDHSVAPPDDLPTETTTNWVAAVVDERLAAARDSDSPPAGLVRFMQTWLQTEGSEDATPTAENAAVLFNAPDATFASLVAPEGGGGLLVDPALNRYRSSISARGAWMLRSLLCVEVGAGPPGTPALMSGMGLTRRQALEQTVSGAACTACHNLIDPPGYALEGIDPLTGEPRTTDDGLPIDTSGSFSAGSTTFTFSSIDDLAPRFATSCDVARCFVKSFTNDATVAVGLPPLPDDEQEYVLHEYLSGGQALHALVVAFVQTPTFLE